MLKKYFIRQNYFDKYKKVKKHLKILKLSQTTFKYSEIESIWKIPDLSLKNSNGYKFLDDEKFYVFGIPIHFNKINWHKDSFSGYEYSLERFDNIKINQLFNRGIDVVFPWEQSRFYFAVPLAIKYLNLKDDKYYNLFKTIILDWINKNPFLYGINWYSTMDVAIRAINWVVAVNLFGEVFHNDKQFKLQFTKSLVQHAEYVSSFPAIYEKGHITNHTTSAYAGLLFLAITLRKHAKSKSWLKQAVTGLLKCMNYQVYDDGIDFEGSIPYHRLVLEIFCFSAIVCLANNIELPVWYFTKLFKMIEFTASYIDCQGNAPQIGDNDSGRVLIFSTPGEENFYLQEHDHSYLLDLGKIIFDNNFPSQCKKQNEYYKLYFPLITKMQTRDLKVIPHDTEKSSIFPNGGAYFLKNEIYSLLINSFPIGQNGRGGHNHLDKGSYTLSIHGIPAIVDPGTATYTMSELLRNKFRNYTYHNNIYTTFDEQIDLSGNGYWGLKDYYNCKIKSFNNNHIQLEIKFVDDPKIRYRKFLLIEDTLVIEDLYSGDFISRINFDPEVQYISSGDHCVIMDRFIIQISKNAEYSVLDYDYSPYYGKVINAKYLRIHTTDNLNISIKTIL